MTDSNLPEMFNDEVVRNIDPLLAGLALLIDKGAIPEQNVVLVIAGTIVSGRLVSRVTGTKIQLNAQEGDIPPAAAEPKLPYHIWLSDATVQTFGQMINVPVLRVKLSHVSAWVKGDID